MSFAVALAAKTSALGVNVEIVAAERMTFLAVCSRFPDSLAFGLKSSEGIKSANFASSYPFRTNICRFFGPFMPIRASLSSLYDFIRWPKGIMKSAMIFDRDAFQMIRIHAQGVFALMMNVNRIIQNYPVRNFIEIPMGRDYFPVSLKNSIWSMPADSSALLVCPTSPIPATAFGNFDSVQ